MLLAITVIRVLYVHVDQDEPFVPLVSRSDTVKGLVT